VWRAVQDSGPRPNDATHRGQPCPVCGAPLPARAAIVGVDRLLGLPGSFVVHVCATCGSGVTAPYVAEQGLAALYPAGYGSHEETERGAPARAIAALKAVQVALILHSAPLAAATARAPGRALDVGCGRGDLARGLLARGWQVDGIEPSQRASELAAARGVRMLGATLSAASLQPQYDLVVLRHSLEHLPDPVADLQRVRGALAAGGHVAISLPNFASWQRRWFASRWFHLDVPRHRVHFTPDSLALALDRAGLATHTLTRSTSVLGLPASVQYLALGRCLAPGGMRLRAIAGLCVAVFPMTSLLDRLGGERDTLHALASAD
jgi:SAM-dependent methyltransferase